MAKYYLAAALLTLLNYPPLSPLGASQHLNSSSSGHLLYCHAFTAPSSFHSIKLSPQYIQSSNVKLSQVPIRKSGVIGLKDDHSNDNGDNKNNAAARGKNDITVINSSNGAEKISTLTPKHESTTLNNDGNGVDSNYVEMARCVKSTMVPFCGPLLIVPPLIIMEDGAAMMKNVPYRTIVVILSKAAMLLPY